MVIDDDFIRRFKEQIQMLESMKEAIEAALKSAQDKLKVMDKGKTVEEVFGPE